MTSLQPLFRTVAGGARRSLTGHRQVAEIAGKSKGWFGCCKWNLSATKLIVERFWWGTGRRLVCNWSPTSSNGSRQSQCSFQSLTDQRSIAYQLQTELQTVVDLLLIVNIYPTDHHSIADQSPTDHRQVDNCSPIISPHGTHVLIVATLCLHTKKLFCCSNNVTIL